MNEQIISSMVDSNPVVSFYQIITENAFDGVVILDAELMFTYISPNSYKLFGYEPSEMYILVPTELIHPDDLPYLLSELQKLIEHPNYIPSLECRFSSKNGQWIWIEVKCTNFFNHQQVKGLLINFKVINDRKIREQKLKHSEALLAATLRHSRFSIWSVDLNHKLIYTNEKFANDMLQTFGVTLEVGMKMIDVLPEQMAAIWLDRYNRTFANESFIEEDVVDLGDRKIYIEISSTPIVIDNKVVGASFYGEDITERKLSQIKLVHNTENLSKLLNASNLFVNPKSSNIDFDEVIGVLRQISGAKYVVFNRLYVDHSKTISLSGLEKTKETIMKYLNIDILSTKWKREEAFESKWMNNKMTVLPDVGSILFTDFKPAVIQLIIKTFNIGNVMVMRIDGNERIVGNLIFIYENGKTIENPELNEMFTYQLGQYIERMNAEDALNQKVNEMERFHKLTVNRELTMIELKKEVNDLLRQMGQEDKYRIVN